jgi:outer membrane protein assembly factor BamB
MFFIGDLHYKTVRVGKPMKKHLISVLVLFLLISSSLVGVSNKVTVDTNKSETHMNSMASPWPMYCHDKKHTGRSPYNTAENTMEEKWRFTLSGFSLHCAPIFDLNGTIYVGREKFYAIYPNGTVKWEIDTEHPLQDCPALDEQRGVLYYGTQWDEPKNYLYAVYLSNGTIKWAYPVGNDITSSPVIDNFGNIYFGDWDGNVHAVYPDGSQKWSYQTGDVITSSPAIGDDETIYIGSHDDYVYAFYPNGTVKWQFLTGNWVHGSPTIGSDGTVYIGSDDNFLYALNPNNGSMIWRVNIGGTWCSPTLGPDGMIYLGVNQKQFHAIYPNGTIKWTYNAPGRIWFGASAALSNDGILYFGTTRVDGGIGAFIALNSENGTERFVDYFGKYETSPSIAPDGTIYAVSSDTNGDYGYLHAFGPGEPKKIVIEQPEQGKRYLGGIELGKTISGNILIIGSVNVKVNVYSSDEIESVHFYVDGVDQNTLTEPPFEWRMNQRYGDVFPLKHTITVTGYYSGGYTWSESIDVMYLHFLK